MRGMRGGSLAPWLLCVGSLLQVACAEQGPGTGPPASFIAQLPVAITSMSAAQWVSLATRLDQSDNPMSAPRTFDRGCTGCPNSTMTVQIAAVSDARFLGGDKTPNNGAVALRIIPTTLSSGTETKYGYRDSTFAYLLVVTPPSGSATYGRWTLVNFSWKLVGSARQYTFVGVGSSGALTPCNHPPKASSDAKFATCLSAAALHGVVNGTGSLVPSTASQQFTDPIWVSCLAGCCEAT